MSGDRRGSPYIICDIDGTLLTKREDLREEKRNWYTPRLDDELIVPVARVLEVLHPHHEIILVSGRKEKFREVTLRTLERYKFTAFDALCMRASNDNRKDEKVKLEILKRDLPKRGILFAIDDRPRLVRMWRNLGIFTFDVNARNEEF